ncbi:glycoside hydrolase family 16 protein [Coniophora puteana RWD-64-598 SS2]|uniref:Glycoside hydrolase family 16 protein n=1 Tax=Coniophora puteana (strain RWD-64-598) TaxID=741705 RepID=A0A5M3MCR3_CONPW|nr:glycoside hydrolase family 16 protein [Coniophora puteana RWD-64-598 SS2]EIW76863.1 glycoside hydrolase family 16 protein [Coniophora puteana RWD-64-598 SS2]
MNSPDPLLWGEPAGSSAGFFTSSPRSRPPTNKHGYSPVRTHEKQKPNSSSLDYALPPNPADWGALSLYLTDPESDDYLHNPDPVRDYKNDYGARICTRRGLANLGCMMIVLLGCLLLFAVYPVVLHFTKKPLSNYNAFNVGGLNASGQIPSMLGSFGLIDVDTPKSVYTKPSYTNPNEEMDLVFSDEFNVGGRTFWPGDDPYWEAPSLHYWATNDLEWYDPAAVTTQGGALRITLSEVDPASNHNLKYRSGMFCFTGGIIEAAVVLPGSSNVHGLWPAIWTMGNLGRAGYGATLDGLWPYSYDSCDVGTLPNQTFPGTAKPEAATKNGDPAHGGVLSYLPGQRLSACTCSGESHPGPVHQNGQSVGRSAPEIDIFEATVDFGVGKVSQSAQIAPFNEGYRLANTSANLKIYDPEATLLNPYIGGAYQQTLSGLSVTNPECYELNKGCYSVYAFEYKPGFDDAYITWVNGGKPAWTLMASAIGSEKQTEIGARAISQEPMYIIANLGFSTNFGGIDFGHIQLPATMLIDYIRVYQPKNGRNIGCDPPGFPTATYIKTYAEAYNNPNITEWGHPIFNQSMPKNRLNGGC